MVSPKSHAFIPGNRFSGWQRKPSKRGKIIKAAIGVAIVAAAAGIYAGHKGYSPASVIKEFRHKSPVTMPKGKNESAAKGNTTEGYLRNRRPTMVGSTSSAQLNYP